VGIRGQERVTKLNKDFAKIENRVPLAIILGDDALCQHKVEVSSQNEPIQDVASRILALIPGYKVDVADDVLTIHPSIMPQAASLLLSSVIPRFAVLEGGIQEQQAYLWMHVRSIFRPSEGSFSSILSSPGAPAMPAIETRNLTVQQTLNRLISRKSGGAWVLLPIVGDLEVAVDHQLLRLTNYADPSSIQERTSCIVPN